MRSTKYTRAVLAPVVARARSLSDVIRAFGVKPTGGTHRYFKARIANAGLDTSHFGGTSKTFLAAVPPARLAEMVRESGSYAQLLAKLELPTNGRPVHELKRRLSDLGIATDHFHGARWNRGQTRNTHPSIERGALRLTLSDDDVFSERSVTNGSGLKRRLLRKGWPYRCAICGLDEWHGVRLSLHVDHINGAHYDNRLENLRLLCPNCHSQTPTYCRRRR